MVLVAEVKVGGGDECDRMIIRCLFQVAQGVIVGQRRLGEGSWCCLGFRGPHAQIHLGARWVAPRLCATLRRMVSETVWISVGRGADGSFRAKM